MSSDALFWDNLAERYSRKPVSNLASYQRKLDITRARLRPADVILDVGCGTGSLALELAPGVAHVHALDYSAAMIGIGRRKAAAQKVTNVTFHQKTLAEPNLFEPEQFDGVCAYNILHLVEDRAATVSKILEYLKPGGFFISSTVCLGDSIVPYRPILSLMRAFGKAPMVRIFNTDTLLRELGDAGFVDIATPDVGAKKTIAFVVATKPR